MEKKIICFSVCILLLVTYAGAISSSDVKGKTSIKSSSDFDFSHTILGEFFTLQVCTPSKYSHLALNYLYNSDFYPFYYITMVYDDDIGNKWAEQRGDELGVEVSPTVVWDGDYKEDKGSNEDVEEDMADYNESIIACGNRNVKDIDLNLDVEWLGAVNIIPPDGATDWIGDSLCWNISAMNIDIIVNNNEENQYNGHLHVYVTEINSTMWVDKWDNPYTFAFLDYAWNENINIGSGSSWNDSIEWDGCDRNDGYGHDYFWIEQDNVMIIASVFDEDNNDYADETTGFVAGVNTDPKCCDLYFGNSTPPPKIADNITFNCWIPPVEFDFDTTYYWKVNVKDAKGNVNYGDIWSFTTRGNDPPNEPGWEHPVNGSIDVPIMVNLSWIGGDSDGDNVTYDIYFGDSPENMKQIAWNQTEEMVVIQDLGFQKTYYWYVVAWDEYGECTVGSLWNFTTEQNYPPNPAKNPRPPDGDPCVPAEGVILSWNGSDPNFGDTFRYDLYFDDVDPPLTKRVSESWDNHWEIPFTLPNYNTYYWKVDTYDKMGEFAEGYVWSFSTGPDYPPTDPIIDGPLIGGINKEYEFTFVSTNSCNHSIWYEVRWYDGTENITDLYPPGQVVTLSHSWETYGPKLILARACDEHECSDWSDFQFTVTNSKIFNLKTIGQLLLRSPNMFPILQQLLFFTN